MKKRLTVVFILLALVLSACAVQPQETSAPTETTAPTQPTEATKPTEPPTQPTEPPTQPTEPTTPQLADPVEIKTYSVESAYIDVLNINGLATSDTGKFHTSLQSLTKNLDYHKEHEFFKSTAQFDGLYAKAAEIDFAKNYVALVYFVATADYEPDLAKVLLLEDFPFNGERIFRVHVNVNYDDSHDQFMRTDISKVKYHFLMITIPKTEIALNGIIPKDASVDNMEPPTQPTEPELSYKEKLQQYTEITDYKLKFAYNAKLESFMGQGWNSAVYTEPIEAEKVYEAWKTTPTTWKISLTSTNAACPQSFKEICAQYDAEFFKHSFLLLLTGHGSAEVPPSIEKILVGEPLLFNRSLIAVHDNPSFENEYYSVFVELPLKYLEYAKGDGKCGDLPKWDYENMLKEETEPPYKDDGLVISRQEVTDYSIKMAYCDIYVEGIVANRWCGRLFESADGLSKFINARCNTPELGTKAKNDICPKTFEEVGAALLAETDFAVSNVAVFYVLGTPDALPDITKVEYVDYTIDSTVGSVKSFMISLTNFGAVVGDISQVKYYQVFITVPKTYEIPKTQPEYPFVPTFLNRVSK